MSRFIRLTDSDIARIVGRVASGREKYLLEAALQIAIRHGGSTVKLEYLDEVLNDLDRNLVSGSLAQRVSNGLEAEYDSQQPSA